MIDLLGEQLGILGEIEVALAGGGDDGEMVARLQSFGDEGVCCFGHEEAGAAVDIVEEEGDEPRPQRRDVGGGSRFDAGRGGRRDRLTVGAQFGEGGDFLWDAVVEDIEIGGAEAGNGVALRPVADGERDFDQIGFGAEGGGRGVGVGADDDFLAGLEEAQENSCGTGRDGH